MHPALAGLLSAPRGRLRADCGPIALLEKAGRRREVLRRHGLAVVDDELEVIDEKRFATWLDVRQRRLSAPPR
jgi:hypothetical protein